LEEEKLRKQEKQLHRERMQNKNEKMISYAKLAIEMHPIHLSKKKVEQMETLKEELDNRNKK
jgi:hypothetical protein